VVVESIERNLEGSGCFRFGRWRTWVRGREITSKRRCGDFAAVGWQAATHREYVRIEGMVFVSIFFLICDLVIGKSLGFPYRHFAVYV
jgi:hypothetical protein